MTDSGPSDHREPVVGVDREGVEDQGRADGVEYHEAVALPEGPPRHAAMSAGLKLLFRLYERVATATNSAASTVEQLDRQIDMLQRLDNVAGRGWEPEVEFRPRTRARLLMRVAESPYDWKVRDVPAIHGRFSGAGSTALRPMLSPRSTSTGHQLAGARFRELVASVGGPFKFAPSVHDSAGSNLVP